MASLKITPLHPSLGAEVAGVDLARPIDEPTRHALSRALAEHLVLVLREQALTPGVERILREAWQATAGRRAE